MPAEFAFSIRPPFWQTWWFILGFGLLIAAVLTIAYRYRVAQLLKVERMRTRIAADLHDDVASSLSSVALYADVVHRRMISPSEDIQDLLGRIRDLSRESIEKISLIVWAIDPSRDELTEVFQYFQRHATPLCTAAGLEFEVHIPESIRSVKLTPDQRRTIYLILKEGINNALRHGKPSRIEFIATLRDGTLELHLRDNGLGFDPDHRARGHGLTNMRERATRMGALMDVSTKPGKGTSLSLLLKV